LGCPGFRVATTPVTWRAFFTSGSVGLRVGVQRDDLRAGGRGLREVNEVADQRRGGQGLTGQHVVPEQRREVVAELRVDRAVDLNRLRRLSGQVVVTTKDCEADKGLPAPAAPLEVGDRDLARGRSRR
jgi:hypothetical protein